MSDSLAHRVEALIAAGRIQAARPLLAAWKAKEGARTEALEARLLLREGRAEAALGLLDIAIAEAPDDPALRIDRADARLRCEDAVGAAGDAAEAVLLDPADARAKATLGAVLIELGRPADAIACLRAALSARPDHAAYREGLAVALERDGQADAAAELLDAGIAAQPGQLALRTAAIMLRMRQRRFADAASLAQAACRDGVADARVFGLLGHARSSLGQHDAARDAYAGAFSLAPEDPYVRHLVAAAGDLPATARAPAEYVSAVFDGYAGGFEAHLIGLGYRVPGLVRRLVQGCIVERGVPGRVLDLGCGTGLLGVALGDLGVGALHGVDLSPRMLAQARRKGLYASLECADVTEVLARGGPPWPMILAGDVLCYFGGLEDLFVQVSGALAPGGRFIFSVESLARDDAAPWRLGKQGRYAHATSYIHAVLAAAGLGVAACLAGPLRDEDGVAVEGLVIEAARPDA